jgi:RHS repeat-associated protein
VTQTLAGAPGGQLVTRYAYDVQGNLTSVTDPNGNVTSYAYDDFGRMQRQTSLVSGVAIYTYDVAGNVLTTTDANGGTTTRTYDTLNRVLSSVATRGAATETVSWTYDDAAAGNFGIGQMATMTDPTGSTVYRYERRGLLQSEAKAIAGSTYTTSFTYDANGNRSAMNYPNGIAAHYTFDFADRPYSLMNGATSIVSSATYLPFGPLTSLAFGNGTTRTMRYDVRYRPLENKLIGPGGTIADYNYAEDNNGNITQIHDATDATYHRDFGYDDLNRLTTANTGTSLWGAGSYTYDAMGNMVSSSLGTWKSTASTFVGTTPKLNNVVENGMSRAVAYDAVGNETAVGASSSTYSPRNTLASADTSAYVYDGRGVLTIATISMLSLNVVPSNVTGGNVATGTVTLSAPAAADTTVNLTSSNPTAAGVPSSVLIAAGGTTASFTVTTQPVGASAGSTITATFNQYTAAASVLVVPADLSSITLSPSTIVGGDAVTGTITLTGPAAMNLTVSLGSNNSAASVPASVSIAAGSASANFPVTTTSGVTGTTAVISATLNATTRQATLVFADAELSALSISPSSILNSASATGTVTLTGRANTPVVISLSSSSSSAYLMPPNNTAVTVPAGASSATFTMLGLLQTTANVTATITASHGAVTRQAMITVNLPWVSSFTISPQTLAGGNNAVGTATINAFPPGNCTYNVTFTSTNTSLVATPKTINYCGNTSSGQTTILTNPVLAQTPVVVTAHDPTGVSLSQTVTLQPAPVTLNSFTVSPTLLVGSNKVTGTVTLTAPAPAPGIDVDLQTPPPPGFPWTLSTDGFVHVPTGSTSANFNIGTPILGGETSSSSWPISAVHSATTKTATITLQPPASPFVYFDGIVPSAGSSACPFWDCWVTGGNTLSGAVTTNTTVQDGKGVVVTLSSSNTAVLTVPSSVKIPKGTRYTLFTISTRSVTAPVDVIITGTSGGITETAHVAVLPPNVVSIQSVTLRSSQYASGSVGGQIIAFADVALTGGAPAGGLTLSLSGARPDIIAFVDSTGAPTSTVTVPAGWNSTVIQGKIYPFTGINHATTISATSQGVTRKSGLLLITAMPQAQLKRSEVVQCASLSIAPCLTALAAFHPSTHAIGDTTGYDLYTPELHLLAETEITTASSKSIAYSYLWLGDVPVASVETATNTTRWYATDHLGTPYIMTDSAGATVWRAEYAPYGSVFSLRTGPSLHQPLRFPGQMAQDGTETYYNVFRHYRSSWGRYTQPDPIGLTGGLNVFAYVDDNPTNWSDPRGLKVFRCCRDIEVNVFMNGVARLMGFKHCFLKTDSIEAGMGPADNGALPPCPIGVQTAVTNHKGQSQSSGTQCTEVKDVNEKCVNDELGVGRPLGRWMPWNQCNSFADDVLRRCKNCSPSPPSPPGDNGKRYF